jgi:hypothetical protein
MSQKAKEPLRGEAAWRSAKEQVSKHNDAAFARARAQRVARDAEMAVERRAAERRERDELPQQPQRP